MVVRRSTIAALLIAGALLSACGSGSSGGGFVHGVSMRGLVVRAAETETIVCIGRADGAAPGQIFIVYRYLDPGSEGATLFARMSGLLKSLNWSTCISPECGLSAAT